MPNASLLNSANRLACLLRGTELPQGAGGKHQKKGVSTIDTPETGERPLALLRRLLLAALRSLLRHYSSLECGSSALLPVVCGPHRWAERSTLIQDVDYG